MGFTAGHEHSRTGTGLDLVRADLNPQRPLENVPCLVIAVVEVPWRDQARRSGGTARVPPFGNHESIAS